MWQWNNYAKYDTVNYSKKMSDNDIDDFIVACLLGKWVWGFTLLSSQVISVAFYSEREKSDNIALRL